MTGCDIAVVGGGPAGAAITWHLAAAGAEVVLIDDKRVPWRDVGQQLASSALTALQRIGLADRLTACSAPVHEARSIWAGSTTDHRLAILDPHGPPRMVDRAVVDHLMRAAARTAGARLLHGRAKASAGPDGTWQIHGAAGIRKAGVIIDATGPARALSRHLAWQTIDRLHCAIWRLPCPRRPQYWSLVEASPDGWWYTAPSAAPGQLTVLHVRSPDNRSPTTPPAHTTQRLTGSRLPAPTTQRITTIGHAPQPWAPGLIAAGDAAFCPDPLSSSGLRHALDLAPHAAAAALGLLDKDQGPAVIYERRIHQAFSHHQQKRQEYYTAAAREQPTSFWHTRATSDQHQPH